MKIKYDYRKENKFKHRFIFFKTTQNEKDEIYNWLQQSGGKYNVDYVYWSLINPRFGFEPEIYVCDNAIGMAFKLRWL